MRSYLALGSVLSNAKDYKAMAELYDEAVGEARQHPGELPTGTSSSSAASPMSG